MCGRTGWSNKPSPGRNDVPEERLTKDLQKREGQVSFKIDALVSINTPNNFFECRTARLPGENERFTIIPLTGDSTV
jgi:hypothetical protein